MMNEIFNYNVDEYPFISLISKLFNKKDLDNLHQQSNESYMSYFWFYRIS